MKYLKHIFNFINKKNKVFELSKDKLEKNLTDQLYGKQNSYFINFCDKTLMVKVQF